MTDKQNEPDRNVAAEMIVTDNSNEFNSSILVSAALNPEIVVTYNPEYRGEHKGVIERAFRTMSLRWEVMQSKVK